MRKFRWRCENKINPKTVRQKLTDHQRLPNSFFWPRQRQRLHKISLVTQLCLQQSNCYGFSIHEEPSTHSSSFNPRCCCDCVVSCCRINSTSSLFQVMHDWAVYRLHRSFAKTSWDVFSHSFGQSPRRLSNVSCTARTREMIQYKFLRRMWQHILGVLNHKMLSL